MKIHVVKLSAFGDIIHTLPALDDLLSRPEVDEVHWLVDARYAFVTEVFPVRVKVHKVALQGDRPLGEAWQMIRHLRHIGFDAVIDLHGLLKSGMIARAVNRACFGFDKAFTPENGNQWLIQPVHFHPDERHVVQQYRRIASGPFLQNISQQPDAAMAYAEPRVQLTEQMHIAAKSVLEKMGLNARHYAILHLGGGWQTKQLPANTWAEVADGMHAQGIQPVFSWGSEEEHAMARHLSEQTQAHVIPERLGMSILCGLLAGAKTAIGADTGVLHLAAALGTPTISFWGPSASWRSGPKGEKHWHIESNPDCGPCFKRNCDHFICMEQIRASAIIEALHAIIRH
jgi:heptosyltransferase-1